MTIDMRPHGFRRPWPLCGWLFMPVLFFFLLLGSPARAEPPRGLKATAEMPGTRWLQLKKRGNRVLFTVRLPSRATLDGSISYAWGSGRLNAEVGYLARYELVPLSPEARVRAPLHLGLRCHTRVSGKTLRPVALFAAPVGISIRHAATGLATQAELAPNLLLQPQQMVVGWEGRMGISGRF